MNARGWLMGASVLALVACGSEDDSADRTPDVPAAGTGAFAGAGGAPTAGGGAPVAGTPAAGGDAPVAGAPVAGAPVAGMPVAGAPVAGMPVAGMPAAGEPAAGAGGVAGEPIAGAAGEAATPGEVPTPQVPDPTVMFDCPPAPDGADPQAVLALDAVNAVRLPTGAGCATMAAAINMAAQNHCDYYAQNTGSCTADPHSEVESCSGFTGTNPGARMQAAGYAGRGSSEVMAFSDDAQRAIDMWVNSVWHRIPVLDPWTTELGYGHATSCDTIDFGRGTPAADDVIALYPYHGQVDVPPSFDGSREGPMPPAPPTGWPSASPVTVYATDAVITEHLLTIDGDDTPIEHMWLTSADSNFLRRSVMMYGNAPLQAQTTYRVRIVGTYVGGPLELEWTFTTGDAPRFGRF